MFNEGKIKEFKEIIDLEEILKNNLRNKKVGKYLQFGDNISGAGLIGLLFDGYLWDKSGRKHDVVIKVPHSYILLKENLKKIWDTEIENSKIILKKVRSDYVVLPRIVRSLSFTCKENGEDKKIKIPIIIFDKRESNLIERISLLDYNEKIRVIDNVIQGLSDVFKQAGLVHNDIHPGNILYDKGRYQISDFGFGKLIKELKHGEKEKSVIISSPSQYSNIPFFPKPEWDLSYAQIDSYMVGALMINLFLSSNPIDLSNLKHRDIIDIVMSILKLEDQTKRKKLRQILTKSFTNNKSVEYNNILEFKNDWDIFMGRSIEEIVLNTREKDKRKMSDSPSFKSYETSKNHLKSFFTKLLIFSSVFSLISVPVYFYLRNNISKVNYENPNVIERQEVINEENNIDPLLKKFDVIYTKYTDDLKLRVKRAFTRGSWEKTIKEYENRYGSLFTEEEEKIINKLFNKDLKDLEIGEGYKRGDLSTLPNPVILTENQIIFKVTNGTETYLVGLNIGEERIKKIMSFSESAVSKEDNEINTTNPNENKNIEVEEEENKTIEEPNEEQTVSKSTSKGTRVEVVLPSALKKYANEHDFLLSLPPDTIRMGMYYHNFQKLLESDDFKGFFSYNDTKLMKILTDKDISNGEVSLTEDPILEKDYFINIDINKQLKKIFIKVLLNQSKNKAYVSFPIRNGIIEDLNKIINNKVSIFYPSKINNKNLEEILKEFDWYVKDVRPHYDKDFSKIMKKNAYKKTLFLVNTAPAFLKRFLPKNLLNILYKLTDGDYHNGELVYIKGFSHGVVKEDEAQIILQDSSGTFYWGSVPIPKGFAVEYIYDVYIASPEDRYMVSKEWKQNINSELQGKIAFMSFNHIYYLDGISKYSEAIPRYYPDITNMTGLYIPIVPLAEAFGAKVSISYYENTFPSKIEIQYKSDTYFLYAYNYFYYKNGKKIVMNSFAPISWQGRETFVVEMEWIKRIFNLREDQIHYIIDVYGCLIDLP